MNNKLEKIIKEIQTRQINKNLLIYLLDNYYQCVIYNIDELTDEEIYKKDDEFFPEELTLPLEIRKSGILEALNLVLNINPNVNENTGFENALMVAVGNADSFIVEYLLDNGANPLKWPNLEEDETNYYLDERCYCFTNPIVPQAWHKIVKKVKQLKDLIEKDIDNPKLKEFIGEFRSFNFGDSPKYEWLEPIELIKKYKLDICDMLNIFIEWSESQLDEMDWYEDFVFNLVSL